MSRVKAVVDRSIMVHLHDVVPGDVLHNNGTERDPIIEKIERDGEKVRFIYRARSELGCAGSFWMDPTLPNNGHCFIHDFKNEREEFLAEQVETSRTTSSG